MVEPRDPLQSGEFDRFARLPGPAPVDDLGFVQPVDGLGQGVGASRQLRRMVTLSVDLFG
jgi:hypothetical protein